MSCEAQAIVDLTPPLNGIPLGLIPYAQLALLCAIAQSMDCTPTTLLENAKCLECSIPPGLVQYASLALLCSINAGGGGGSATDYILEYANQSALPAAPADVNKVWLARFRDGSAGKTWSVVNQAWFIVLVMLSAANFV